eukprot:435339_1
MTCLNRLALIGLLAVLTFGIAAGQQQPDPQQPQQPLPDSQQPQQPLPDSQQPKQPQQPQQSQQPQRGGDEKTSPKDLVAALRNAGLFETLVTALQDSGLDETLQSNDTEFTVFAPTQGAFDALPANAFAGQTRRDALKQTLLNHVVPGQKLLRSDLQDGQVITMASGQNATISFGPNPITGNDSVFINETSISAFDIEAPNGVVHVIDGVILPDFGGRSGKKDKQNNAGGQQQDQPQPQPQQQPQQRRQVTGSSFFDDIFSLRF